MSKTKVTALTSLQALGPMTPCFLVMLWLTAFCECSDERDEHDRLGTAGAPCTACSWAPPELPNALRWRSCVLPKGPELYVWDSGQQSQR